MMLHAKEAINYEEFLELMTLLVFQILKTKRGTRYDSFKIGRLEFPSVARYEPI